MLLSHPLRSFLPILNIISVNSSLKKYFVFLVYIPSVNKIFSSIIFFDCFCMNSIFSVFIELRYNAVIQALVSMKKSFLTVKCNIEHHIHAGEYCFQYFHSLFFLHFETYFPGIFANQIKPAYIPLNLQVIFIFQV